MPPSRLLLERIQRLRELFLDDDRGAGALDDYWRSDADLVAYDAVLGARIGWKWDAVLAECEARGFGRADGQCVLDFGCGSGIAAQRFTARFGAGEVLCHDRSRTAVEFAVRQLRKASPALAARAVRDLDDLQPDVLLISHVLGELDARGEASLRQLILRSRRVVIVEPGNRHVARRLSTLRDELRAKFTIVAPCTHALSCPALANENDWCHFFAAPPPEVFTSSEWVLTARALGIDLRALPYAFLALIRDGEPAGSSETRARVLGRPELTARRARVQVCDPAGLRLVEVGKRDDPVTWRALKKHPESVRFLPHTTNERPEDQDP